MMANSRRAAAWVAALALLFPVASGSDDSIQVEVACRNEDPLAVRVTMKSPGAVAIPVLALFAYCERTHAQGKGRPGT